MTAVGTREDLVPLRTDFDLVWRGYDQQQVQDYVRAVETDLRLLAMDRDAAVGRAEDLGRQLEAARSQVRELLERVDRICRSPIEPDALGDRLRRMIELAHEEAAEITRRAEAAAENSWAAANQTANRLRHRHEQLIAELTARRQEMEAEHRELMRRANEQVAVMTRQAEQRRRQLDDQAADLRQQVEADFRLAMARRRAEAMRAMAEREAEARARAERLTSEAEARAEHLVARATEQAQELLAEARRQLALLRERRDRVAAGLRDAQRLIADADPLLRPLPEEAPTLVSDPEAAPAPAA